MPQSDDWSKTWHSFLLHTWDFSFWRFGGRSSKLEYFSWGLVIFAKWRGQETLRFNYAPPLNQIYSSPTNWRVCQRGETETFTSAFCLRWRNMTKRASHCGRGLSRTSPWFIWREQLKAHAFQLEQTANIRPGTAGSMQLRSLSKRRHHEDRGQTRWASLPRFSHRHRSTQKERKKGEVEQILTPVIPLHKVSPC